MAWTFDYARSVLRLIHLPVCAVLLCGFVGRPAAGAPAESGQPWLVRQWETDAGLPQNTVNALVETRDGFLWLGTNAGLSRFDGLRFRNFGLQDGLRSVQITALAEDAAGALWIGTVGGGVSRYERGMLRSFTSEQGFPTAADVVSMCGGRDGTVWIGTAAGMVRWKDGGFTMVDALPRKQIRAMTLDRDGRLWASVIPEGIFREDGKAGFERIQGGPKEGSYCLLAANDGSIWAGHGALWRWHDDAWQKFGTAEGAPKGAFTALAEAADGTLWIGTDSDGAYTRRGERFESAPAKPELSNVHVRQIVVDREGLVWMGAISAGLSRFSPRLLQFWGEDAGLEKTNLNSLAEDDARVCWVGAASKGIYRFEGGRFSKVEDAPVKASGPRIYSVASRGGVTWAAGEQCLFRFRAGEETKLFNAPPVKAEAIRALCPTADGVWLGTYYSTLLKCDGNEVRVVAPPGTFRGDIRAIVEEAPGVLLVASASGVHRWENGVVRSWTTKDGLLTENVRALLRDEDGTLWLGTLGGGMARLRDGKIASVTTREGLVDDVISQVVADDAGALWLGSNRGILRVERSELEAVMAGRMREVHPMVFGRNEGMLTEQCAGGISPTALRRRDGHLLFPTARGMAEIDPAEISSLRRSPARARIDGVAIDERAQALGPRVVVPPGQHRVEFSFTAPALRGGEWVRFQHRLEGWEKEWVSAGSARAAVYEGLPPGEYTLRVRAANAVGMGADDGAAIELRVEPLWWQRWWVQWRALAVASLATAAGVFVHVQRKHRRQLAELERTRQQHAELTRAGRIALMGELSASLAHELSQPLTSILSNAQAAIRFMDSGKADLEEIRAILGDIAEADRHAGEVIRTVRAMVRKSEPQMTTRDLISDVEHALKMVHSDLVARNVKLSTYFVETASLVKADQVQIQQVLLNLVMNGCDAMRGNPPEENQLRIETTRNGDRMMRVSVRDRGSGIPPEMLQRIFEPFVSTKEHGLGMGLAICQAIVQAHGGQLWAENNPDRGATFHFTLPLAEA
jgi:signal transduction histidine kinase/ligand-binding sensor domain-containing protein